MELENQVPLKDTCLKLQAADIDFDSHFMWMHYSLDWGIYEWVDVTRDWCKAPMIPELLEKLPIHIKHKNWYQRLEISKFENYKNEELIEKGSFCSYGDVQFENENLPEALAQMLLWLHENNYLNG